jgi:predicted MFS family arabinose efflux permease
MTWGISNAFIPIYLQETFSLTYGELGFYMSLSTVSGLLSAPLTGRFVSFDMRSRFIMFVQPIILPLYLGLVYGGTIEMVIIPLLLINFLGSMVGPMVDTLIGDIAPPGQVGSAYGVIDTFLRVGISAGSVLGGLIIGSLGFHGVFLASGLTAASTSIPILLLRRSIANRPHIEADD